MYRDMYLNAQETSVPRPRTDVNFRVSDTLRVEYSVTRRRVLLPFPDSIPIEMAVHITARKNEVHQRYKHLGVSLIYVPSSLFHCGYSLQQISLVVISYQLSVVSCQKGDHQLLVVSQQRFSLISLL